MDQRALVVIKC